MKKMLVALMGVVFFLGLAGPALADVFVFANIDKDKYVDVKEDVYILKDICIDVDVMAYPEGAAEANVFVNQTNEGNFDLEVVNLDLNIADPTDGDCEDCDEPTTMSSAIYDNVGIVGVNQSAGNLNNQGNVVSIAAVGTDAFANAEASAQQGNYGFCVRQGAVDLFSISANVIWESVNNNTGIVGVNQATGSLNNQLNAVALAVGLGNCDYVALSESDLGQFNIGNCVLDGATLKLDLLVDSVIGNCGVVGVNQSSGLLNNQANVVSISASGSF